MPDDTGNGCSTGSFAPVVNGPWAACQHWTQVRWRTTTPSGDGSRDAVQSWVRPRWRLMRAALMPPPGSTRRGRPRPGRGVPATAMRAQTSLRSSAPPWVGGIRVSGRRGPSCPVVVVAGRFRRRVARRPAGRSGSPPPGAARRRQGGVIDQRLPGGERGQRKRGRLHVRHSSRLAGQVGRRHRRVLGGRAIAQQLGSLGHAVRGQWLHDADARVARRSGDGRGGQGPS